MPTPDEPQSAIISGTGSILHVWFKRAFGACFRGEFDAGGDGRRSEL
jgi:hypothetical protein